MADTEEELRAKAMASMASSSQANSNSNLKQLQSKEEGEISPSPSEVDMLTHSAPTSADAVMSEPSSSNLKSEHAVPGAKLSRPFLSRARVPFKRTHYHKQRKQLPVRFRSHTWPVFSNDNLVITFSDDENASDFDDSEPDGKKLRVDSLGHNPVIKEFDKTQDKMLKKDALNYKPRKMHHKELEGATTIMKAHSTGSRSCNVLSPPNELQQQNHNPAEKDSSIQTSDAEDVSARIERLNHKMEMRVNESNNQKSANQRSAGGDSFAQHNVTNVMKPARFGGNAFLDNSQPSCQVVRHSKFDQFSQRQSCNGETSFGQTNPRNLCKSRESLPLIIEEPISTSPHIGDKVGSYCRSVPDIADAHDKPCNSAEEVKHAAGLNQGSSEKFLSSALDDVDCQDRISNDKLESMLDGSILDHSKLLNWSSLELESLLKLEEMQDKELAEAQELRHRCEHEERLALKAYRKAQRSLIDANNRCSLLYKKIEVFSAKLRDFIMKGSGISWPSGWPNKSESALDLRTCPKVGHNLGPNNFHSLNAEGFLSHSGWQDGSHHNALNQHTPMEALPGQCFLPIACTSDPKHVTSANASHALREPNLSQSNDEFGCPSSDICAGQNIPSILTSDVGKPDEKMLSVDVSSKKASNEDIQDYELEAVLRSMLVAKLGVKASEQCSQIVEVTSADTNLDMSASNNLVKNVSMQIQSQIKNGQSADVDYIDDQFQARAFQAKDQLSSDGSWRLQHVSVDCVPSDVLRIVSRHVKLMLPKSTHLQQRSLDMNCCDSSIADFTGGSTMYLIGLPKLVDMDLWIGSFVINPFWPLCMFELRGKCNDEECQWQHLRICGKKNQMQRNCCSLSDSELSSDLHHNLLSIPSYQIGSVFIKDDEQSIGSLLSHSNWHYWHVSFCSFFRLPFSVERIFPSGAPMLHGCGGGHASVHDNSERKCVYFQNLDGAANQTFHGDVEKSLEMALNLFSNTINKAGAKKKAITVLSRSIEVNPRSVVLWVMYLHIFYGKEGVIGEDDLFLQAVRHNESSYELWLVYINSRMQLENRMKAYDDALSALCSTKHISNLNIEYHSACILDIFLQMLDFFCMSGNSEKAVHVIHRLLDLTTGCMSSESVTWSNVASCLIVSDQCIFWICCVYAAIYKKLPLVVVQQLELSKDLPFGIQWTPVQLTSSEKDRAVELMKKALEIFNLIESSSSEKDLVQGNNVRPGHFLAVSHVRFIMVIEGCKGAVVLLDEYLRRYPTCLELVTLLAHLQKLMGNGLGFEIFESALCNWPKHLSGLQCLWNQYVEHALDSKSLDVAKNLMQRWFSCFCNDHDLQSRTELPLLCLDRPGFYYDEKDVTFGNLNLYLFMLLQKETIRAQLAINEALKQAPADCFEHCVREHASFYLGSGAIPHEEIPCRTVLGLLSSYIGDARNSRESFPLSRGFFQDIKKRSIRNLINNLLGPLFVDSSVLNSALEESYGMSLLPEFSEIKDLVDLTESLMEISPANYKLAISVRKKVNQLLKKFDVASASLIFWANSLLVNSICKSFPPPPEHAWLEVADLLSSFEIQDITERFHELAVLAYPFSLKLWRSHYKFSKSSGKEKEIVEAARERGFEIC